MDEGGLQDFGGRVYSIKSGCMPVSFLKVGGWADKWAVVVALSPSREARAMI